VNDNLTLKLIVIPLILVVNGCTSNVIDNPPIIEISDKKGPGPIKVGTIEFACEIASSIVSIYSNSYWVGSGIMIDSNTILTAYHVVSERSSFFAFSHKCENGHPIRNENSQISIESYSIENDYAILHTLAHISIGNGAKFGTTNTYSPVWIYSSSRWGSYGHVVILSGNMLMLSGIAMPGDSGGAIIDETGSVIGMIQRKADMANEYFGVAIDMFTQ
jgi:S1-C subfamily serine protease